VNLQPIITAAGLSAVFNATNDGLVARITQVALGDAGWEPSSAAQTLRNERQRVLISNGNRIQPTQIHITAIENGVTEYWVREIGFILDDGTLFAIWSHPTQALAFKAANVDLLLAFDLLLAALPDDSVEVIGTGGVNLSPGTETILGVMRFATTEEALEGDLTDVAMTPKNVRTHGDARYARNEHGHTWGSITGKPTTFPPSTHGHTWNSVTGKPTTFPPSTHSHPWNSVTGKPTTFPPSTHSHTWNSVTGKPARFPPADHRQEWDTITGKPETFPPATHRHTWASITNRPATFPPASHNHDGQYIRIDNFLITDGFVRTNARQNANTSGFNNFNANFADIFPPTGFTMSHLRGFTASIGIVYFAGNVDGNDVMWCRWSRRGDRVRVICANSENRVDAAGATSYINYFAVWRR